ncbi:MAG: hypothetical protein EBR09_14615 [Proteobacteria bacterium]|nr:hypothetical protein [Pseudomonadota bacterium]
MVLFSGRTLSAGIICITSIAGTAFAQQGSSGEYTPPAGEQPAYGKRYTPGSSEAQHVLEINAAQLANKGFELGFETRGSESMNFGADLIFSEKSVKEDPNVSGNTQSMLIAPKIRLYPMQALQGVFLGGKLFLGQIKASVSAGGVESENTFTIFAPAVHVGYRFLSTFGFTWSVFGGAGVNFPQPKFEEKYLKADAKGKPGVSGAIDQLNQINRSVRYDIGITLGVAL